MEFKTENGIIYAKVYHVGSDEWVDITEDIMHVVDDYLDYKLDLKFGTNLSSKRGFGNGS